MNYDNKNKMFLKQARTALLGAMLGVSVGAFSTVAMAADDNDKEDLAKQVAEAAKKRLAGESSPASEIVRRLKRPDGSLNIEDMALANDALVRLELLQQIEQKLSDIDGIRRDREVARIDSIKTLDQLVMPQTKAQPKTSSQGSQLEPVRTSRRIRREGGDAPGGGLTLPTPPAIPVPPAPVVKAPARTTPQTPIVVAQPTAAPAPAPVIDEQYKLRRIAGVGGDYIATVETEGGERLYVGRGDVMPDGSKVMNISVQGLKLINEKGKKRTIKVSIASSAKSQASSGNR